MSNKSIVFLGSKASGLRALKRLVANLPQSSVSALICPDDTDDERSECSNFQAFAMENQIPFHIVATKRDLVKVVQSCEPDVAIVHGWYRLIPIREFPRTKFFGFHYSQLPRYRGNAPLVWQIINGEERLGVSFFELSDGLDDGLLLAQDTFKFGPNDTIANAIDSASEVVDHMIDKFAVDWQGGNLTFKKQPDIAPSYCGLRLPDDGKIDWTLSARTIHNFVRAQTRPYPGAFSTASDGTRVYIWRSAIEPRTFYGTPGAVVEVSNGRVVVACGSGALAVFEAQYATQESQPVEAVIGSLQIRLG